MNQGNTINLNYNDQCFNFTCIMKIGKQIEFATQQRPFSNQSNILQIKIYPSKLSQDIEGSPFYSLKGKTNFQLIDPSNKNYNSRKNILEKFGKWRNSI